MNLQLEHITRKFHANRQTIYALQDFNLSLNLTHGIYAFVGPNGSGKTTLFKILCGLLLPAEGEIKLDSQKLKTSWIKNNISLLISGDRNLYQRNTVMENAVYYGVLKGLHPDEIKENVHRYSKLLDCDTILNRWVEGLSSGERKKAGLLMGLSVRSKIMLVDEPTWGLDIDTVLALQETFEIIQDETELGIFISSHDTLFLSKLASEYVFLKNGACSGTVTHPLNADELISFYKKAGENNDSILV